VQSQGEERMKIFRISRSRIGGCVTRSIMKYAGERKLRADWAYVVGSKP